MATCNNCKTYFKTLPDEERDHPCPACGWYPGIEDDMNENQLSLSNEH